MISQKMDALNLQIAEDRNLGRGFEVGHSYCEPPTSDQEASWFEFVIRHEIEPLLREYWFDEPDKVRDLIESIVSR